MSVHALIFFTLRALINGYCEGCFNPEFLLLVDLFRGGKGDVVMLKARQFIIIIIIIIIILYTFVDAPYV